MQPRIAVNVAPSLSLLKKLKAKAADLTPVFEGPIANSVYDMFKQIFLTEGAYAGSRWQPLSALTLRSKARIGRGGMGILRRYNTLWASLTKRSHPLGYRIVTPNSLIIGTSVPYAASHQTGTKRVPQRQIVPEADLIPVAVTNKWEILMLKYLEAA